MLCAALLVPLVEMVCRHAFWSVASALSAARHCTCMHNAALYRSQRISCALPAMLQLKLRKLLKNISASVTVCGSQGQSFQPECWDCWNMKALSNAISPGARSRPRACPSSLCLFSQAWLCVSYMYVSSPGGPRSVGAGSRRECLRVKILTMYAYGILIYFQPEEPTANSCATDLTKRGSPVTPVTREFLNTMLTVGPSAYVVSISSSVAPYCGRPSVGK